VEHPAETAVSRALIRRLESYETFPLEALETVVALRRALDTIESRAVGIARERGATWDHIAEAAGVTRQAVYQKHRNGKRVNGAPEAT
jgi:predicted nucleic acid-binding protein